MMTRWAGGIWLLLVTAMFGGVSLLRILVAGDMLNDWEVEQFRAGHAHAGVLLIMGLAYVLFLERTQWSPTRRKVAMMVFLVGGAIPPTRNTIIATFRRVGLHCVRSRKRTYASPMISSTPAWACPARNCSTSQSLSMSPATRIRSSETCL